MILYQTWIPTPNMSKNFFLTICHSWFAGSEKSKVIPVSGDAQIIQGRRATFKHLIEGPYAAMRYIYQDENEYIWTLEAVYNADTYMVRVVLSRDGKKQNGNIHFKIPHLIQMLCTFSGDDKGLPSDRSPIILKDEQEALLRIAAENDALMHTIVIPVSDDWTLMFDPGVIARDLRGLAHVVVITDPDMADDLYEKSEGIIQKNGIVTVISRNDHNPHYYRAHSEEEAKRITNEICARLLRISRGIVVDPDMSWLHMMEMRSAEQAQVYSLMQKELGVNEQEKQRMEQELQALQRQNDILEEVNTQISDEKKKLSDDYNEIFYYADGEIRQVKEDLERVTKEKLKLENENYVLRCQTDGSGGLLRRGDEDDYYANEMKAVVIETLQMSLPQLQGRRKDIIESVLKNNEADTSEREQLKKDIESAINSSIRPNQEMVGKMRACGFKETHESSHYKFTYKEDPRYMLTVAASPSDFKTVKNNISTVMRMLF